MQSIRNHLLWIIPLLTLMVISLVHQLHGAPALGQRMITILQRTPFASRLRGALPVVQNPGTASNSAIVLQRVPQASADAESWSGEDIALQKVLHGPPLLRAALADAAMLDRLEKAFSSLGYVDQKPLALVLRACEELLSLSDEDIFNSLIRADVALLQQADDPAAVARMTLLLVAWDLTGIVAALDLASGGHLYAVETLSSVSPDSWNFILLRIDSAGSERWHGTLHMPRKSSAPSLAQLASFLPQLDTPAPNSASTSPFSAPLLTQPLH